MCLQAAASEETKHAIQSMGAAALALSGSALLLLFARKSLKPSQMAGFLQWGFPKPEAGYNVLKLAWLLAPTASCLPRFARDTDTVDLPN